MKNYWQPLALGASLMLASGFAMADDLEGNVESINAGAQSFTVQGIEFFVTPSTKYDEGLTSFGDIKTGQKVEVDYVYRDEKHYVTEVELDN